MFAKFAAATIRNYAWTVVRYIYIGVGRSDNIAIQIRLLCILVGIVQLRLGMGPSAVRTYVYAY